MRKNLSYEVEQTKVNLSLYSPNTDKIKEMFSLNQLAKILYYFCYCFFKRNLKAGLQLWKEKNNLEPSSQIKFKKNKQKDEFK